MLKSERPVLSLRLASRTTALYVRRKGTTFIIIDDHTASVLRSSNHAAGSGDGTYSIGTTLRSWAGGRVLWLCLGMFFFFLARSDEVLVNGSGVVHPSHCLTQSDAAFLFGDSELRRLQWSDADLVEVRFRGHKGDQVQIGSVVVGIWSEVRGPCSELVEGGRAVTLLLWWH